MKGLLNKKAQIFSVTLSVLASVFLVGVIVYAATTISTNIETAGTVTMDSASTSNDFWVGNKVADDDDYLYMDASGSEYLMWDDAPHMFVFSDDLQVSGNASTTGYIRLGNLAGDDDDYLYFDATGSEYLMWDDVPGEFDFTDDVNITGKATSSISLWVGAAGTATNLDMTGGDVYVQNDVEIDGGLYADSATTTDTTSIGGGTAIREYNFGTCDFADRASFTASTTAYVECLNATGIASGDNIYVMATSSLDTNFIIQAASSTNSNIISLRILNNGNIEDTTLNGATLNWQSIR